MKSNNNAYQLVLVFKAKLPQKDREVILEKITEMVKKQDAEIGTQEDMGSKELAYEIKGQLKGDFLKVEVKTTKEFSYKELNLFLNREAQVIRYLVLKK